MKGYVVNIEKMVEDNNNFRSVLYTAKHSQLVLMALKPKEEIGSEVHEDNDQFFRIDQGQGLAVIDGKEHEIRDGYAVVIPAGTEHNVINTSETEFLKLYTIYSPPHHRDAVIHETKEQAESDDEHFEGETTE